MTLQFISYDPNYAEDDDDEAEAMETEEEVLIPGVSFLIMKGDDGGIDQEPEEETPPDGEEDYR